MRLSRRSAIAVGVFGLLAALAVLGRWYESQRSDSGPASDSVTVNVTNGDDRGPGTLREALFLVAAADGKASISIEVPKVIVASALPPIVNAHGVSLVAQQPGVKIDARNLKSGPVFDVAGANISIEGLHIEKCAGAGILLRATHFTLTRTTVESCDVGVDVAENARDVLLERNRFLDNRIGVRFAASSRNTAVVKNEFSGGKDAGVWAVRSEPDLRGAAISVRDNKFTGDRIGMLAGNVSVLAERNELVRAREAAIHIVGAGAVVRGNRVSGGGSMGIVAENARAAIIDNNELDSLAAYGIMVRGSSNTLVRSNRLHNCAYGLAFVLGDARSPSTAVENTVIEPKFNGIDVIGDSPILRRNHVLRARALALHVEDFERPDGEKVLAKPFLEGNVFGNSDAAVATGSRRPAAPAVTTR